MARGYGQRVANVVRRKAVRTLQSLLAAGVDESEACEQIVERFNVSSRTAHLWLRRAYEDLSKEVAVPRDELLGLALKRRRLAMAKAAKDGDWKTYLQAADSEAKLLGLNAPVQTEHHVLIDKVQDMSRAVVDVVKDFFADDPAQRARFVEALRTRLNAQLTERPDKVPILIDAGEPEQIEAGDDTSQAVPTSNEGISSGSTEAPDPRLHDDAPSVAAVEVTTPAQ
jgi:hypothetical protein